MEWTFPKQYNGFFGPDDNILQRIWKVSHAVPTLQSGSAVASQSGYAAVPSGLFDNGSLDLRSGLIVTKGSLSGVGFAGTFTFSATTTTITIYWDGTNSSVKFKRLGVNGEVTQISGSSMTITGLTANTEYGFIPFYSAYNTCGIGFVKGDAGTPQFAFTAAAQTSFALQQQNLVGREAITSTFIKYKTTAAGSSSGGGTGGGTCVMSGTCIEPLGDLDHVEKRFPQDEWIHLKAKDYPRSLYCTPDHPLFHAVKGKMQAKDFVVGDLIVTDCGEFPLELVEPHRRRCVKIKVEMDTGHLFWANGYLSHNAKIWEEPI